MCKAWEEQKNEGRELGSRKKRSEKKVEKKAEFVRQK